MEQQSNGANPGLGQVQCKKCQSSFQVEMPPTLINNHPLFTSITVPHEQPVTCPLCGQLHAFFAVGAQVAMDIQMIADNSNRIIVPQAGLRLT